MFMGTPCVSPWLAPLQWPIPGWSSGILPFRRDCSATLLEEEEGTGSGMGREQSAELLQLILPSHCWEHLGKGMHSTYQNLGDGFQHFGLGAKTELNHPGPGAVVTEGVEGGGKGGASGSGGLSRAAPSSAPPQEPLKPPSVFHTPDPSKAQIPCSNHPWSVSVAVL